jgi:hypothetical protein
MPRTRHVRRRVKRKTQRRFRYRGGGDEDDFYAWSKTQKTSPRTPYITIVMNALQRGVEKFNLDPKVAAHLLDAYKSRTTDLDTQAQLEEILVKFGQVERDSAKRIVVG